jgi:hypothetical protein
MHALALADQTRVAMTPNFDPAVRSKLGQFMTLPVVVSFMAGLFSMSRTSSARVAGTP